MSEDNIIEVRDLVFEYPDSDNPAVRGVSLDVRRGEFLCVLGHNGSGKSTLAKMFNALLLPTSGSVTVCGIATGDPARVWDLRQNCGMVFQNPDNQIVATVV